MDYHIAQLNLAKAKYPLDDPRMKGFVDLLETVNKEGENSPGFIWILKDETGTAVNFNLFNDPSLLINLTVWENLEELKAFIYNGNHAKAFMQRRDWFEPLGKEHLALWWVPEGHIPTLEEAKQKMEKLWAEGPSAEVFTFKKIVTPVDH